MTDWRAELDAHVRHLMQHHFSPETGTPFWLRWAEQAGIDPREAVQGADDLKIFGNFDKSNLRGAPHEDWTPRALAGTPFHVFETGGTTGLPTQRLSWRDHRLDYERFAPSLSDETFPRGSAWLILGPTGPRRLRLAMEHLAQTRGGIAYHVDLDPRWVRKILAEGDTETAQRYQRHVIDQAVSLVRNRDIRCIFATPRLLEFLGEVLSLHRHGITGALVGGTSMSPQTVRFLVDEVLEGETEFVAVYGNTLMGLAESQPVGVDGNYEVIYHAPVPRALLRVVDDAGDDVPYGTRGRVQLTTLTEEFFMPNLLERDEAIRRPPTDRHPWDGVGDVRPLGGPKKGTIEGVY
jgi:phenylacetate-coenzyme A ligase PaaK-like adenylate-forming protein